MSLFKYASARVIGLPESSSPHTARFHCSVCAGCYDTSSTCIVTLKSATPLNEQATQGLQKGDDKRNLSLAVSGFQATTQAA